MPDFTKEEVSRAFLPKLYAMLTALHDVDAPTDTPPNMSKLAVERTPGVAPGRS